MTLCWNRDESYDGFNFFRITMIIINSFKLCGIVPYIHDMDILIECFIPIMVDVSGMTKIMNSMLCVNEVRAIIFSMIHLEAINFIRSDVIKMFVSCSNIVPIYETYCQTFNVKTQTIRMLT